MSSDKPSIIYILERFPSPTEGFILNEIIELEKRGLGIIILVLRKQKKYFYLPELKLLKSPIIYLPKILFFLPFGLLLFLPQFLFHFKISYLKTSSSFLKSIKNFCISLFFVNQLKGKNIKHFHAHFAFITVDIASFMSKIMRKKYSFTAHAQDIYCNNSLKEKIGNASFLITCTKYNRDHINKLTNYEFENKIISIYHGIKISKWKNVNKDIIINDPIVILTVARLVEKKGLIYLLMAVKILVEQGEKIKCTIIGEGPLEKELKLFINTNKLNSYVEILNFIPQKQIKNYLSKSDIFILSCVTAKNGDMDGLPNVLLEAMLMGLPIISTGISAIPELIEHRTTGILVKENDEKSIADAILELKNNKELVKTIISKGKQKVCEKFSNDSLTTELIKVFNNHIRL